jgi:tetratricopeptide (TPR) repeat protein
MRSAPSVRLPLVFLALVGLGIGLSGCKPGTALHSRYNNFRAYYNTFYNAERSLEAGEGALERSAVTVDRNQLVAVFPVTSSAGTTGPFQEAIDKSADLLRERPSSKWADDALLVIGKAYFYQRNFAGADQKFRETMAAAEAVGDERLGDEARFWLGRTYAASNRFDEGVALLEEGLADDEGDQRWHPQMRLALGELYARAGRWDEAAEELRLGAPEEGDADVAARAYVLLGQVEEQAGRWDDSAQAYTEALRRNPAYELGYAARVGRALVIGLQAGRPQEGLDIIRSMRSDDKNYDRRGELALIEARLRAADGQTDRAFGLFRDVLYDETLAGQSVRGQAHYRLAEFYRDVLDDYVRASAHFDTAATSLRAPSPDVRPTRSAILDAPSEAQTYRALAETARLIADTDSLLALGDLSEEEFQARIEEIEAVRLREYREEQRRLQEARTAQEFSGGGVVESEGVRRAQPNSPPPTADAGFLSYRAPSSIQAGLIAFEQVWGDRPLVPNWRRRAAIQAGDVSSARGVVEGEVEGGFGINEGPPPLDLSAVPRTPAKRAELVTELAGLRYELANAFFLSLGRADTAAALYRRILADTPDLPVATRARYALAEIERAAGREDAARPLYEAVAAADSADALRRASRIRLGLEPEGAGASVDSSAASSPAYDAVRKQWRGGDALGAADAFVALGDADPDAAVAPRAYLAAAIAYTDWTGRDSTALVRPMPDSLISPVLFAVADSLSRVEMAAVAEAYAAEQEMDGDSLAVPPDSPVSPPAEGEARAQDDDVESPRLADDDPSARRPRVLDDDEPGIRADRLEPSQSPPQLGDDEPVLVRRPASLGGPGARPGSPAATPAPPPEPQGRTALPLVDSTSFTVRHHLRALAARYAGTSAAARATELVAALPPLPPFDPSELRTEADPEALLAAALAEAPPPLPADSAVAPDALPDTTGGPPQPASGEPAPLALDSTALAAPVAASGLRGDDPLDPSAGGYTWRVRTLSIPDEGVQMVDVLTRAGFRAAILRETRGGAYVIAIGRFDDETQARAARDDLPAWAQLRGEVVRLDGYEALPERETPGDDGP